MFEAHAARATQRAHSSYGRHRAPPGRSNQRISRGAQLGSELPDSIARLVCPPGQRRLSQVCLKKACPKAKSVSRTIAEHPAA